MKNSLLLLFFFVSIQVFAQNTSPEENLKKLNIQLPELASPIAAYVNSVRVGNLIYLSGKGPKNSDGTYLTGKLGQNLTIEEGYYAAQLAAIEHLAVLKHELKDLSKVKRIVKVLGMVNATDNFTDHPKVINGYSEFMQKIFGEKGLHARSAVGHNSLPMGMAVEVEAIIEIED